MGEAGVRGIHWHAEPRQSGRIHCRRRPIDRRFPTCGSRTPPGCASTSSTVRRRSCSRRERAAAWSARTATIVPATRLRRRPSARSTRRWRGARFLPTLPFVHREAVKALTATYASEEAADVEISRALRDFYQGQQPQTRRRPLRTSNGRFWPFRSVYRRNLFPEMNVSFGSYPSNIGHIDFPGCFRCHDDEHKSREGKTIGQDCESCHTMSNHDDANQLAVEGTRRALSRESRLGRRVEATATRNGNVRAADANQVSSADVGHH